ncbi:short-chain dehydrogenase [Podospora appendiculata]|uniref:Short-chain dehydrogenase n=1 Tax=Podospora appendiculata TaxID=314037 RepID=A0AAE0XH24_9PEZI|nr:short-chain dehydrogenase [Podospora appendiculata]
MATTTASKPIVFITGANQGIGYDAARQLASSGKYHVVIGARSLSKAEGAISKLSQSHDAIDASDLTPVLIDVTDDASITAAAKFISDTFGHIDVLINNAGISGLGEPNPGSRENFRLVFETNVFGLAAVTDAFLPLLRASKYHDRRIVNVSSGLGQIGLAYAESEYGARHLPAPVYRSSKAAVNMLSAVYAETLAQDGILVVASAPGYTRTNFTRGQGNKDVSEGAGVIVRAATEGDPKKLHGKFLVDEYAEYGW